MRKIIFLVLISFSGCYSYVVDIPKTELVYLNRDLGVLLDHWFVDHSYVGFRRYVHPNSPMTDDEEHLRNAFQGAVYNDAGHPYRLDGEQLKGWFRYEDEDYMDKLKNVTYNFDTIEEDGYMVTKLSETVFGDQEEMESHFKVSRFQEEKAVLVTFIAYGDGIQSGVFYLVMVRRPYSWLLWEYGRND